MESRLNQSVVCSATTVFTNSAKGVKQGILLACLYAISIFQLKKNLMIYVATRNISTFIQHLRVCLFTTNVFTGIFSFPGANANIDARGKLRGNSPTDTTLLGILCEKRKDISGILGCKNNITKNFVNLRSPGIGRN